MIPGGSKEPIGEVAKKINEKFGNFETFKEGSISKEEFLDMEQNACPTCGSCAGMFTANSMNCLMEVIVLCYPVKLLLENIQRKRLK